MWEDISILLTMWIATLNDILRSLRCNRRDSRFEEGRKSSALFTSLCHCKAGAHRLLLHSSRLYLINVWSDMMKAKFCLSRNILESFFHTSIIFSLTLGFLEVPAGVSASWWFWGEDKEWNEKGVTRSLGRLKEIGPMEEPQAATSKENYRMEGWK